MLTLITLVVEIQVLVKADGRAKEGGAQHTSTTDPLRKGSLGSRVYPIWVPAVRSP